MSGGLLAAGNGHTDLPPGFGPRSVRGFCCPVPLGPRVALGFHLARGQAASASVAKLSFADNLRPDNGGIMPGDGPCLYQARRSCFAPVKPPGAGPEAAGNGGGAGYCPRVRNAYSAGRLSPEPVTRPGTYRIPAAPTHCRSRAASARAGLTRCRIYAKMEIRKISETLIPEFAAGCRVRSLPLNRIDT